MIIETGDVIAVMGKGLLSKMISKLTGPVSHVGIVTGRNCSVGKCMNYNHINVTQALDKGITTITLASTLLNAEHGYCLQRDGISDDDRAKMAKYALSLTGTGYAYTNLFWQAVKQITGKPQWTEYFDSDKDDICSELVALAYLHVGLDFGVSPRDCTPSDCYNYKPQRIISL